MNRARSQTETSVGLFAFLDVLMSTMGSLILVLMVVTPKIRQEAVAKAAAEVTREIEKPSQPDASSQPINTPPETVDLNSKLKIQIAELSGNAEDRRRELTQSQATLVAARKTLQDEKTELAALEQRLDELHQAKEGAAQSTKKISAEKNEIEHKLAATRARLRTIHGEIAQSSTRYSFVAYDGVSGTTRRPILIECTKDHIKFLQEDIALTSDDVNGFTSAYNPVLAGSQALVDYWLTHAGPGEPKPYILIVVRPSGTVAYYLTRKLLERLRGPFGYELLSEGQQLVTPPPVPEAVAACRQAIDKTLAQRNGNLREVFGDGTGAGSRIFPRAGRSGPADEIFGGPLARRGTSTSPFDKGTDPGTGAGQHPGSDPFGELGASSIGQEGSAGKLAGAGSDGTKNGAAGKGGGSLSGSQSTSSITMAPGSGRAQSGSGGEPASLGFGPSGGDESSENGIGLTATPSGSQAGGPADQDLVDGLAPSMQNAAVGDPIAGSGQLEPRQQSGSMQPAGLQPGILQPANLQPGALQSGINPSGPRGIGQSMPQSDPSGSESVGDPGQVASTGSQGSPSAMSGSPTQSSMGSEGQSAGESNASGSAMSGMPTFGFNMDADPSAAKSSRSVRHQWGMASPGATIGFERDVTIYVESHRIYVGGEPPIPCGRGESNNALAAAVVAALDRDARTWGRPPDNFYWVPNVKFVISPGGNQHYERIRKAITRHGLISSVDFRLDTVKQHRLLDLPME